MVEIYKDKRDFVSTWASPEHASLANGTETPLDGLGHLVLQEVHFSGYVDAIIDNAKDMPEVCVRMALVRAFGRKRFVLCHKFHAGDDTRQYLIRFSDVKTLPCRVLVDRCAFHTAGTGEASLVLKPSQLDVCGICGGGLEDEPRCYNSYVQPIPHADLCTRLKVSMLRREVREANRVAARNAPYM
jgi:hypothetical protein